APVCSDFTRDRPHSEIEIFCGTDWGTPMSHDVSAFGFSVYPVIEFDSVEVVGRVVNKLVGVLHYSYSFFIGLCLACFGQRSEEHTSELQSRFDLVCRLLLEKR